MYTDVKLKTLPATAGQVTGSEAGDHPAECRHEPKGTAIALDLLLTSWATFHLPFIHQGEG